MSARSIRRSHQRRVRAAAAAGVAIGGSALLASGAQAATFTVTNTNDAGAGSLRVAIGGANGAAGLDDINFTGAGASGEIRLLSPIPINDDLRINGPGAGTLAISGDSDNDNVRDFATSAVTLGDTRIFNISDPSSPGSPVQNVTISGLTLKEGVADSFSGSIQEENGGAIYSELTALTLRNVVMTDNVATGGGGAVTSTKYGPGGPDNASLTVVDSTFTSNRAGEEGGAILSSGAKYGPPGGGGDASTVITNSQITGNRAGGTDFGGVSSESNPEGGGVSVKYSDVDMSGVNLSGNTALTDNGASNGGEGGGGDFAGGRITDSVVSGNVAGESGGGLQTRGTHVRTTTVSGNTADETGGGVAAGPGKYTPSRIDSSTVSGNSTTVTTGNYSGFGGGIVAYATGASAGLITRNSTIASNTAPSGGSGITVFAYNEQQEPAVQLHGTIVADNVGGSDLLARDTSVMTPTDRTGAFSAGFSLVENPGTVALIGDPADTNLVGVDPQLAPLADNGGPTQTQALAPTSPAVDSSQAGPFTTDQRGQARTVDAVATNSPISDGTDIGAYELADPAATGDDPETEFKKKPKKKVTLKDGKQTAKVKLKFKGIDNAPPPGPMTFECKIDKGAFDECKSPLKLELEKGKHKIEVRAIDADGNVDSSPAKAKIKVKKAKKKK